MQYLYKGYKIKKTRERRLKLEEAPSYSAERAAADSDRSNEACAAERDLNSKVFLWSSPVSLGCKKISLH